MNKKEIIIIAVAVLIVALGGGIYYWSSKHSGGLFGGNSSSTTSGISSSTTMQPITSNVTVPDQNASSVPAGVAAPAIVASGSPSGTTKYRSFDIKISGGAYTPSTVIVNTGDTVHINLTAVDAAYDFTQPDMGLSLAIPKGSTKVVQFDANTAGKLTFYCKSCGGPMKGPTGYIEVVAK